MQAPLPAIPAKRYFTIGEVSELCGVKPYVLRYWEQEFAQLRPMKRRGNRRYYQHHEVLLVRRIRELLYDQGFTINGARGRLSETAGRSASPAVHADGPRFELIDDDDAVAAADAARDDGEGERRDEPEVVVIETAPAPVSSQAAEPAGTPSAAAVSTTLLRSELTLIRDLLAP